jgi:hypothetical protein
MPYEIPTSTSYQQFFSDVNNLAGNNIPAIGVIIMFFFIALMGSLSAGKRFEVSFAFASWIAAITSFFVVIFFNTTAYIATIPMLMAIVSIFIVYAMKD